MANYNSLKATVNANIKANNNQEITGPVLNSVLNQMINALGDRDIWASFSPNRNRHTIRFGADKLIIDKEGLYFYYKGVRYRLKGDSDKTITVVSPGQLGYYFIDAAAIVALDRLEINWDSHPEIFVTVADGVYPDLTNETLVLFAASNHNGVWEIAGLAGDEFAAQITANYRIEIWNSGAKNVKFSSDGRSVTFEKKGFSIYRDDIKVFIQNAAADKVFTFGSATREYLVIEGDKVNFNANASLNISDFGTYITKKTTLAETDIVLAWYYIGNFQGGLLSDTYFAGRNTPLSGVMTELNDTANLHFGERRLTISSRGFSVHYEGERYNIEGGNDYVFDFSRGALRQYLCLDINALRRGNRTLSATLVELENTLPGANHIVLLSTYYNVPQPYGLFYEAYVQQLTSADVAGDAIFADVETPGKRFAALYEGSGSILSMLFFTDPHTIYGGGSNPATFGSPYYPTFFTSLAYLQKFADMLPFDFVLSGGDWINQSDTKDMACYELGQIKALLETKFRKCYRLLGNHDTNYQGREEAGSADNTGILDQQTIVNLLYNDVGRAYYKIERHNCDIYCFDSGTDHRNTLSSYDKTQLDWFAQELARNTRPDIVLATHIIMEGSSDAPQISVFADAIEQVADAYNRRTSVVVDGTEYSFANVTTGRIRCIIGGHTHYDYTNEEAPIPIFCTRNLVAPTALPGRATYTFDLILIDFTAGVLHAVRVGNGTDRELSLA